MYTYTRKNHFATQLNALQGCSRSKIDEGILKSVKEDIDKNEGIINPSSVKASLRRLGESRYYENIYFIAEMLGWETPMRNLNMSNLLSDFGEYDDAYSKIEKDTCEALSPRGRRVNSLPFSFIIYKLVERQSDLSPEKKEAVLEVLFEGLPQIYKEWINPELLENYDEFTLILRQVQILNLQEIWDKTMVKINSLEISN